MTGYRSPQSPAESLPIIWDTPETEQEAGNMSERHIHPEFGQLTLLPQTSPDNPLAIDPRTRERGLQHVTEIRRELAARKALREAA
jgi:hypothetical protein